MKTILFIILFLSQTLCFAQSKAELTKEIITLKNQVEQIYSELKSLRSDNDQLKSDLAKMNEWVQSQKSSPFISPNTKSTISSEEEKSSAIKGQCNAITAAGTQCKRNADSGIDFCWQHKSSGESKSTVKSTNSSSGLSSGSSSGSGRSIQTGSRGGKYYINKNGNKTYIKR